MIGAAIMFVLGLWAGRLVEKRRSAIWRPSNIVGRAERLEKDSIITAEERAQMEKAAAEREGCRHWGIDFMRGGHCWGCNSDVPPVEMPEGPDEAALERARKLFKTIMTNQEKALIDAIAEDYRMTPKQIEAGRIGGEHRGPC